MNTARTIGLLVLLLAYSAAGAPRPQRTWIVYAPADLDPRIEHQLQDAAARDGASVRIVPGPTRATRTPSAAARLTIELMPEESDADFLGKVRFQAGATAIAPTPGLALEGYVIEASYSPAAVLKRLRITATSPRGFHHALLRVPDLLALAPSKLATQLVPQPQLVRLEKGGTSALIADFPSFPERGVVEGFYGTPWSHQDRLDILRFEGAHAMNVYYYAPKDDPYHRKLWRDAYPPEARQRLGELAQTANQNFVDFCFAISPGLTMAYSSDQDFQVLAGKLASVAQLGVSCFALFLDDVPQELQDPQDRAQFKTLAQAHIYLTNNLYKHLKEQSPANRLTLTPTTYTNDWGNRDYIKELGEGVDSAVSIVWTGPKTFSPAITADQAREWGGYIQRPPLIWDNYPVNDGTPWCRYLGPVIGRDAHLPGAARGLFSNPMIEPHASMIPLQTVADYLWNAAAYAPVQSELHAVKSQYGPEAARQLAPFLRIYGTYYWDEGNFTALFKERRYPVKVVKMRSELRELNAALQGLRSQRRLRPLLKELAPAVKRAGARLPEVEADPAFLHLPDGTIQWNGNYEARSAYQLAQSPKLDGDFSKWESGPIHRLDERLQVTGGAHHWGSPADSSARVALAWDANFLYVGVDVTDPDLYQPFFARGIQNGDCFVLRLETGFRRNFLATEPTGDEYALYFSPGNFSGVAPSIFSDEDYLPLRLHPHDYMREIQTAWKKTGSGYSGDIAIPVSYFAGGTFSTGYEIGLEFGVVKVLRPLQPSEAEGTPRIVIQSRNDRLFHTTTGNPSSFPRMVLTAAKP